MNDRQASCHAPSALLLVAVSLLAGCGGGGGGGGGQVDPCADWGVWIDSPTTADDYSVSLPSVQISGIAPLATAWEDCYPCVPATPGVAVNWTNQATGDSGTAFSWVRTGWLLGWPVYSHHWYDVVTLQPGANLIRVSASDAGAQIGQDCINVTYTVDQVAPSVPNLLAVAQSAAQIGLSWTAAFDDATTDDAGISYRLYRDGDYWRTVSVTAVTDSGLQPGTEYCYAVSAIDTAGNASPQSPAVCETTFDLASPTAPTGLHSIVLPGGSIGLSWTAATDDVGVTGYRIMRNGIEIDTVAQPGYTDAAVAPDTRYCYTVSAYDQSGNDSSPSNESCNDTRWKLSVVDDSAFNIGEYSDIVAAPSGSLHIAYYNGAGHDLRYAVNTDGSWVTTTVASSGMTGEYPSIALDSGGAAHIAYYEYGEIDWPVDELRHATNASGVWTTETIAPGGWFSALAIDAGDHLHVGYRNNGLRHASNASGNWQTEAVAMPDFWISIAVDAADHVHLGAWQGYPANDLVYTSNRTGTWVAEPVDTDLAGEYNSLALDTNGRAHFSYCEYYGGLRYASNASGEWVSELVDDSGCSYTSLALDSDGHAHISYVSGGYLRHAGNATGAWQIDTIDAAEPTGSYYASVTAIAIDADDAVHISYYAPGRKLGYATTR